MVIDMVSPEDGSDLSKTPRSHAMVRALTCKSSSTLINSLRLRVLLPRTYSTMNFQLGLAAAPVTPLDKNGELNLSVIGKYIDTLLGQGIRSVYVNGCTGEGPSFNVQERKLIAEKWVECGRNKLDKIIIQIGGTNMKDSQELAVHAQSIGASAIASLPHLFFQSDVASLVDYCAELTSVVPKMPFMYYHIPGYTGVNINVEEFLEAAQHKLPSLIGVKYSHGNLYDATQSMLVGEGKYLISLGADDLLLSGLVLGKDYSVGGFELVQWAILFNIYTI